MDYCVGYRLEFVKYDSLCTCLSLAVQSTETASACSGPEQYTRHDYSPPPGEQLYAREQIWGSLLTT